MATTAKSRMSGKTSVLAQVAKKACVSSGTVSRVFNNSDLIPDGTRSRVLSAARELGFRPRVGVRTPQIALITEPPHKTVMGGYVNTMTQYICHALSRSDATVRMITEDRIDNLVNSWFDGIIGVAWEEHTIDILKGMKNIPVIWLSDLYKDFFHCIYIDGTETGILAGNRLLGKGHRRIAVIHDVDYAGYLRAGGVEQVMREKGIDPAQNLLKIPNSMPLHLAVKQLIDAGCTAVWVTGEDMKVLEVNWLIQELAGKRVPEDISLMGFENPGISEFLCPSLTTIASPLREMAEKAVELVLRDDLRELQQIRMPVRLIERNSIIAISQS